MALFVQLQKYFAVFMSGTIHLFERVSTYNFSLLLLNIIHNGPIKDGSVQVVVNVVQKDVAAFGHVYEFVEVWAEEVMWMLIVAMLAVRVLVEEELLCHGNGG